MDNGRMESRTEMVNISKNWPYFGSHFARKCKNLLGGNEESRQFDIHTFIFTLP